MGVVFWEWYLQQNELRFLSDTVYKGETFQHCVGISRGYKNLSVYDDRRPADGKGAYTVLVRLNNHFYWNNDSYLHLKFEDDRLVGKKYRPISTRIVPWSDED